MISSASTGVNSWKLTAFQTIFPNSGITRSGAQSSSEPASTEWARSLPSSSRYHLAATLESTITDDARLLVSHLSHDPTTVGKGSPLHAESRTNFVCSSNRFLPRCCRRHTRLQNREHFLLEGASVLCRSRP